MEETVAEVSDSCVPLDSDLGEPVEVILLGSTMMVELESLVLDPRGMSGDTVD